MAAASVHASELLDSLRQLLSAPIAQIAVEAPAAALTLSRWRGGLPQQTDTTVLTDTQREESNTTINAKKKELCGDHACGFLATLAHHKCNGLNQTS